MTVFPFQINEVAHLYNRLSKLKSPAIRDKEQGEPQDVVSISTEAKKRQVLDQAKSEVQTQRRNTR